MKVAVYTCITSSYDMPLNAESSLGNVDEHVLFTDETSTPALGWSVRKLSSPANIHRPNLINRYHKFFPHRVLEDVDITIYIDGNVQIIKDIGPLVESFVASDKEMGVLLHPHRKNIVEEVAACVNLGKFTDFDNGNVPEQLEVYSREGYKLDSQLYAATVLFRKHRNLELLDNAMTLWWDQINSFTSRDQISLPYVLWKSKLPYEVYDIDIFNNPYFLRVPHARQKVSLSDRVKYSAKRLTSRCFSYGFWHNS